MGALERFNQKLLKESTSSQLDWPESFYPETFACMHYAHQKIRLARRTAGIWVDRIEWNFSSCKSAKIKWIDGNRTKKHERLIKEHELQNLWIYSWVVLEDINHQKDWKIEIYLPLVMNLYSWVVLEDINQQTHCHPFATWYSLSSICDMVPVWICKKEGWKSN